MVAIFMPLTDSICVGLKKYFAFREFNNLNVEDDILTMTSKEKK